MGSGKKAIWCFKDDEWQISNSKGTWIG